MKKYYFGLYTWGELIALMVSARGWRVKANREMADLLLTLKKRDELTPDEFGFCVEILYA